MHHLRSWTNYVSRRPLLATFLFSLFVLSRAFATETDCVIHDPSTVIQSDGVYWVFGTGNGIAVYSSTDRLHWKPEKPVFAAPPAWVAAAVPGHTGNDFWAPDIHFVGGRYCLYYAASTFGHNASAIGLVTSPTLRSPHWTDRGVVVRSTPTDNFNAIDPCIVRDSGGNLWMSFGSFWSGIQLIALNVSTGKPRAAAPRYGLAFHSQDPANSVEASCIVYHKGYYYLFVDWDLCCRGEHSTYNIRVGRSRVVTGPYFDREGHDMRVGGGTQFVSATAVSTPGHREVGSGQAGVFSDADGEWFSYSYEWAEDRQGLPMLNVSKLIWESDGWPVLSGP